MADGDLLSVGKSVREVLVVTSFAAIVLVLVGIVVVAVWWTLAYPASALPSHLKDWASVSLGFLAGQLFKYTSDRS
jgi:hypothetical protein